MSPAEPLPAAPPQLPGPVPGRAALFVSALTGTWPGRLLIAGLVLKSFAALVRLAAGTAPAFVGVLDAIGSLALIAAAGYVFYRLIIRAKRRLLWRVRRKLILSYIFIGVVPALLIVSFFVVSGLVLFLNVGSYLVRNGVTNVTNEAVYLARMTAIEIQRGPGPHGAGAILAQRELALASRYPGASIALVPTGPEPCIGSRSAKGRTGALPGLAAASRDLPAPQAAGPAVPPGGVTPQYAGPWDHVAKPVVLPAWVNCSGFGGAIAAPSSAPGRRSSEVDLVLRGVGLPDMARPSYAVIVDIPKNDRFVERIREETSVKIDAVTHRRRGGRLDRATPTSETPAEETGTTPAREPQAQAPATTAEPAGAAQLRRRRGRADAPASGKRRISWVAWLECTDWATGEPRNGAAQIEVNIADIYDRVSATQARIGGR